VRNLTLSSVFILLAVSLQAAPITGTLTMNGGTQCVGDAGNSFGEFTVISTSASCLSVSFTTGAAPFDLTLLNATGVSTYTLFGGIQGYASGSATLGSGNSNYAFLGGTASTASGALPAKGANSFTDATTIAEDIESDIWSLSGTQLVANWVNPDGSKPTIYFVDSTTQGNELLLTGDPTAFGSVYGGQSTEQVTFSCTSNCQALAPEPSSFGLATLALSGLVLLPVFRSRLLRKES
jgi:hypothetical protein